MTFKSVEALVAGAEIPFDARTHLPSIHTHSSINMFATCEQKWFLRYVLGLVKKNVAAPLVTGTLLHLGLEHAIKLRKAYDVLRDDKPDLVMIVQQLDLMFEKHIDELSEKSDMVSAYDVEKLEYCRVQALAMCETWCSVQLDRFLKWKVIDVETELNMSKVAGDQYGIVEEFFHRMGGKLDAVVENQDGDLYVLEHKSRSRMDTLNYASLVLDQQANWYMAAYSLMTKRPIRGFLYNVIQKPQHKMSAKGSDDLRLRMVAAMLDDPEKYFSLVDVIADQTDIRNNITNMAHWMGRMDSFKAEYITRNTSMCDQYGGCSYRPLCQNGAIASDIKTITKRPDLVLFQTKEINTELAAVGTDE